MRWINHLIMGAVSYLFDLIRDASPAGKRLGIKGEQVAQLLGRGRIRRLIPKIPGRSVGVSIDA